HAVPDPRLGLRPQNPLPGAVMRLFLICHPPVPLICNSHRPCRFPAGPVAVLVGKGRKEIFQSTVCRYSSIARATSFEYLTASTTVRAPDTTSPPANTPGRVVCPSASVVKRPRGSVCSPLVVLTMRFRAP